MFGVKILIHLRKTDRFWADLSHVWNFLFSQITSKNCLYVHEKLQRNPFVGSGLKFFTFWPYEFENMEFWQTLPGKPILIAKCALKSQIDSSHFYVSQLFIADHTIYRKYNSIFLFRMKTKTPSKVGYFSKFAAWRANLAKTTWKINFILLGLYNFG